MSHRTARKSGKEGERVSEKAARTCRVGEKVWERMRLEKIVVLSTTEMFKLKTSFIMLINFVLYEHFPFSV